MKKLTEEQLELFSEFGWDYNCHEDCMEFCDGFSPEIQLFDDEDIEEKYEMLLRLKREREERKKKVNVKKKSKKKELITFTFKGIASGDGECFCWNVDEKTLKQFYGQEEVDLQKEINEDGEPFRLYPDRIFDFQNKKKYKITVVMEEI